MPLTLAGRGEYLLPSNSDGHDGRTVRFTVRRQFNRGTRLEIISRALIKSFSKRAVIRQENLLLLPGCTTKSDFNLAIQMPLCRFNNAANFISHDNPLFRSITEIQGI